MREASRAISRDSGKPRSQTLSRLSVLHITPATRVFYEGPRSMGNFVTSPPSQSRARPYALLRLSPHALSRQWTSGVLALRPVLYTVCMPVSIADFARAVTEATRTRTSFEARQTIRAGKTDVSARVRFRAPDRASVEFAAYASPLAEMDDLLAGYAELAPNDLVGSSLAFDGKTTRIFSPKTSTSLVMPGRRLHEPIPGCDALAELAFLDDLTRDYFLRDAGDTFCAGRAARILGLKPKRPWVSSLFRSKSFQLERAEVTIDAETLFPLRVEFTPDRSSAAAVVLPAGGQVMIEYADIRFGEIDEAIFAPVPPAGTRMFTENLIPHDEVAELPFPLSIRALVARGFQPVDDRATVVLDTGRERGYATLVLRLPGDGGRTEKALVLRVGNYISRLMARRRTLAAEQGEAVDVRGHEARYIDRRALFGSDAAARNLPLLADVTWEHAGVFWVLSSEALSKDELVAAASDLA